MSYHYYCWALGYSSDQEFDPVLRCEAYLEEKVVTQTNSTRTKQGGGSHDEAGEQERQMRLEEDDGQTALDETEAAAQCRGVPGHAGEISTKTVCFNSQPEFAPSQKTLSDDEGEENRRRIPTGDLQISSPRPRSIVKSSENPSKGSRAPAGSSSSSPSSDRQEVDVAPPNSPSVLASIGKSSQAKPKSNKRYLKSDPLLLFAFNYQEDDASSQRVPLFPSQN